MESFSNDGQQDARVGAVPWYANAYVLLTIIVSFVATAFAAILLLLLFALPWSSEIIRYMQGKMLTLKSVDVVADVSYAGASAQKSSDGAYQSVPETLTWHSGGTVNMSDHNALKSRQQFQLSVGTEPKLDFAGDYVREGDIDFLHFTALPDRIGVVQFGQFRDRWLQLERQRMLALLSIPLIGEGYSPMSDADASSLAVQFRKTSFFQVIQRLPDEVIDGAKVHHYKVGTDADNLLIEDFYEKVEAARLGRALTDAERSVAKSLFAGMKLKDCDFWIGSRDYYLYRASFDLRVDDSLRRGDLTADFRFSNFNQGGAVEVGSNDVTDVTSIVLSLLSGLHEHLPLAKIGAVQRVSAPSESAGSFADMNGPQADPDHDGLSNALEAFYGTDPRNPDTDGDGVSDGDEVQAGCNPNGPGRLFDFGITKDNGTCK